MARLNASSAAEISKLEFGFRDSAALVDGSGNGYLKTVCDYVHLNPVRANLIQAGQPLSAYPWSSYGQYLKARSSRPPWLRVDRVLGEHAIPLDSAAGRQQFERQMEWRRASDDGQQFKSIVRGWCLGSE